MAHHEYRISIQFCVCICLRRPFPDPRSPHEDDPGAVGTALCLCLAATACTNAADWQPSGKASSSTQGYDTSTIAVQPEIAAMLPPGALSDGVLDVAASTDYAPAEFLDTGGRPVGYDVDLTRAIAAVLGVRGEVHTAEFDSIMASIGNKYDAGISSFTVTREREAAMDMIAYVNVGSQFTVQAGNPQEVDPSDHLHLCGLSVGVQVGTSQETAMQADSQACAAAGREPISVRSYSKQSEATTALKRLTETGPAYGIHVVCATTSRAAWNQVWPDKQMNQFTHRFYGQLSETDSHALLGDQQGHRVDSDDLIAGPARMGYGDATAGVAIRFLPYVAGPGLGGALTNLGRS